MKLTIYMKSGNVIKLSGVIEYELKSNGNEIVGIKLKQGTKLFGLIPITYLLVNTLALDQIEAVTRSAF